MQEYLSFDDAKSVVKSIGLKAEKEWRRWVKGNLKDKEEKPQNIPNQPHIYYRNEWKDWDDWLGLGNDIEFIPFNEAREFIRSLKLKNTTQWQKYYQGKLEIKKPDNIPWNPQVIYKEFIDLNDWIGTMWRDFEEAREFARELGLAGQIEWRHYCKGELDGYEPKPEDIPANPQQTYKQYINLADWLGTENIRRGVNQSVEEVWLPYNEAQKFVHALGLSSFEEWKEYINEKFENLESRPFNLPKSPYYVYKDNGWKGWEQWLGNLVRDKVYKIEDQIVDSLNNILTLYNPYYHKTIIEDHLKVLKQNGFKFVKLSDYELK